MKPMFLYDLATRFSDLNFHLQDWVQKHFEMLSNWNGFALKLGISFREINFKTFNSFPYLWQIKIDEQFQ